MNSRIENGKCTNGANNLLDTKEKVTEMIKDWYDFEEIESIEETTDNHILYLTDESGDYGERYVFFPDAEFDVTVRTSKIKDYIFRTDGKVLAVPGWMEVYGKNDDAKDNLPAISPDDGDPAQANVVNVDVLEDETRPPAPYNEATLLAAMEGAGKFLEDEDLAEAMKERGLGTPATRAQIIEHLLALNYIVRDKKDLRATPKAEDLLNFLKAANIDTLSSPALTGEWEYKLRQMENGAFPRQEFMKEISDLTSSIIEKIKSFVEDIEYARELSVISPSDGKPMLETLRTYRSHDGNINIQKTIGNRKMSEAEIAELLANKKLGPLSGFKSKTGSEFSATLLLDDQYHISFEFQKSNDGSEATKQLTDEEIANLPIIGKCPFDGEDVVETDNAFICKSYFKKKCKLRIAKTVLDRKLQTKEVEQLLTDQKTDLLEGFRSKRTGKLFTARLVLQKSGQLKFEFK